MNRRQFLTSLGIGAPAAVVAAKIGALYAAVSSRHPFNNGGASTGVCTACGGIAPQHDSFLSIDGRIVTLRGKFRPVTPYDGNMGHGSATVDLAFSSPILHLA